MFVYVRVVRFLGFSNQTVSPTIYCETRPERAAPSTDSSWEPQNVSRHVPSLVIPPGHGERQLTSHSRPLKLPPQNLSRSVHDNGIPETEANDGGPTNTRSGPKDSTSSDQRK